MTQYKVSGSVLFKMILFEPVGLFISFKKAQRKKKGKKKTQKRKKEKGLTAKFQTFLACE